MSKASHAEEGKRDIAVAIRSAIVLGGSLLLTWAVALVVRLFLPRSLGPDLFGAYSFADGVALTAFAFLSLGLDTYIQKEIAVRPEHASELFGGITLVRSLIAALAFAAVALVLGLKGSPSDVWAAAMVFGGGQTLVQMGSTLSAMLQASRRVGGLAIVNVVSKVIWGAGTLVALYAHLSLPWLAAQMAISEAIRVGLLFRLARAHLALELRLDRAATTKAIKESLPFYASAIALVVYAKIDVSMMAFLAPQHEIGLYGAAANFSSLAMLIAPLIGWVLMPLFSRAGARSEEELRELIRRSLGGVLSLTVPISLFMGIGADIWVKYAFRAPFAAATPALMILSPIFILTYVAMLQATYLSLRGRGWTVTVVSLIGMCVNPLANLVLVPRCFRAYGEGGAGIGAAIAMILTEAVTVTIFSASVGQVAFDRKNLKTIALSILAALIVIPIDLALRSLGPVRLLIDFVAYAVLVLTTGTVKVGDAIATVKTAVRNRSGAT
ncbi:flippase [soil metagenome]